MIETKNTSRNRRFLRRLTVGLLALAIGGGLGLAAYAGEPVKLTPRMKHKVTLPKIFKSGSTGAVVNPDAQGTDDNASPKVQAAPSPTPARLEKVIKSTPTPQVQSTPALTPVPDDQSIVAPPAKVVNPSRSAAPAVAKSGQQADEERLAQKKRESERKAEETRLAQKKHDEELARQREDERKAEDRRLAQKKHEDELAQQREADRKAEERRVARKRADEQKVEERRLAEAQKKTENEARKAEESNRQVMKAALEASPSAETRARLEKLIAETKDPAQAHPLALRLGEVDLALGDSAAAQTAFQAALASAKSPEASRQSGEKLAEVAAANGDFKTASRQWATLRLEKGAKPDPRVLNAEAMALAAQDDYENAGKVWAQFQTVAAQASPKPEVVAEALMGQALAAELQGKRDEAQQFLRRVEREFSATPQAALAKKRLADLKDPIIP